MAARDDSLPKARTRPVHMKPRTTTSLKEPYFDLHCPCIQVLPAMSLPHPMETIIVYHPVTIDQQPRPIIRGRPEVVVPSAFNLQVPLKLRHPVVSEVAIQTGPVATSRAVVDLGNSPADVGSPSSDPVNSLIHIVETTDALPELGLEARLPSS